MGPLTRLLQPYDIEGLSKIRLGRDYDGGYVAANEVISMTDHLISSEGGGDISFEYDFSLLNSRCDITNYDARAKNAGMHSPRFKFIAEDISGGNDIPSVIRGLKNVSLKIDIEGKEYDAFHVSSGLFPDLSGVLMLVIELHNICRDNYTKAIGLLSRLEEQMTLFHVHENVFGGLVDIEGYQIPNVIELTFVGNALVGKKRVSDSAYPVADLDICNRIGGTDTPLSFIGVQD